MDNTNNLSNSILQSSESSFSSLSDTSSSSASGWFDGLKNINATTWILIVLILAFLGFNIFVYLAKGTQTVTDIFAPLTNQLFGATGTVVGQTVDVSAEGAKAVVGGSANAIQGGLTAVQNATPNGAVAASSVKGQPINEQKVVQHSQPDNSALNRALNAAQTQQPQQQDYEAHEASSTIHTGGQSGWCYVGDDRGFRTCAEIGVNDTCMSGDIFPSQEICMNPNLRT
jgi:hypothetical protein